MTLEIGLPEVSAGVILFAVLQYLTSIWISERLKTSLQKEHSTFLENLKWDLKVREQAVRVAEYLAFARNLKNAGNLTTENIAHHAPGIGNDRTYTLNGYGLRLFPPLPSGEGRGEGFQKSANHDRLQYKYLNLL